MLHALAVVSLVLAAPAPPRAQDTAPASRPDSGAASSRPADAAAKKALAAELWRAGRKAEAIAAYQEIFDAEPTVESGIAFARAQLGDARFNDALRTLDTLAETHKKDPAVFLAFAEAFAARAEARRAEARARGFDELDVVSSEYEAAARAVQDALELDPTQTEWYFLLTRNFIHAGKADTAVEILSEARKHKANRWEIALCEGDARVAAIDRAKLWTLEAGADAAAKAERDEMIAAARGAFEEAAKLAPDRAEPAQRLGFLLLASGGDKAKASELYGRALANDPAKTDLGALLGKLTPKELLAFSEKALQDFKRQHPKLSAGAVEDAPIHWFIAYAKYLGDDKKGAEEGFKTVLAKTPGDGTARYYIGKIAYFDKRWKDAVTQFDTIARRSPKELAALGRTDGMFTPILQGLIEKLIVGDSGGAVTAVAGNPNIDVAIRFEEAILENDPNNPVEWNNLGLFHRDAKHPKEALAAYKRAMEISPRDPRVLNDTAVIYHYYLKSDDAEAKRLYELAIQLAKETIASKSASIPQKENARGALQDAETNLAKLLKGVRRND